MLDDADPAEVAQKIFMSAMFNSGQICAAIKRVYVADSIYDAVCEQLAQPYRPRESLLHAEADCSMVSQALVWSKKRHRPRPGA